MSAHLTHKELTDNLLGVSSLTVNAHLLNCSTCAKELQQMKSAIAEFHGAAHAWSEKAVAVERAVPVTDALAKRSSFPGWFAGWALAAAAMILFAAGLAFYVREYQAQNSTSLAKVASPATAISDSQLQIEKDNALLSQVDSELAEGVPAPMQPLRLLDSNASSTSTTK